MRTITPKDIQSPENPGNGWHIIEAAGEHPGSTTIGGERVDYIQELTPEVLTRIAEAGVPAEGLLVDCDHLSRDLNKPTEAYGWVRELAMCEGNLAALIEWTPLGLPLIQGKIYRHFSTVYAATKEQMRSGRIRPTRLQELALTNKPNNAAGQPAITNRQPSSPPAAPAAGSEHQNQTTPTHHNMDITPEILAALSLADGATPEEVTAAILDQSARLKDAEAAEAAAVNAEADALIEAAAKENAVTLTEEEKEEVKEEILNRRPHGLRYLELLCNSKRQQAPAPARRYGDKSKDAPVIVTNRRPAEDEAERTITNRALEICNQAAAQGQRVPFFTARERARRELSITQA